MEAHDIRCTHQLGHAANLDENFWAQAAAEKAEVEGAGAASDSESIVFSRCEDRHSQVSLPGFEAESAHGGFVDEGYDTQYFQDDSDFGPLADGVLEELNNNVDLDDKEAQDLLAATQDQLKRARPESVHYAKKAKKVDVKRLKDNIWKGLKIVVEAPAEQDTETPAARDEGEGSQPNDSLQEEREFSSVIEDLRTSYPTEKLNEISTSFCFICLLHLANEQGLKIEKGEGELEAMMTDPTSIVETVGDLDALKVWRVSFIACAWGGLLTDVRS